MPEITEDYLRSVLDKVAENTDFLIYVRPQDWASYLSWALDRLAEARSQSLPESHEVPA